MRFHIILLTILGTIATVAALGVFTTPELDTTSAGQHRLQVPAPQPPARFRQATRADIVARQARGPAKRQNSATSICNRPSTGTTPYAIFTDAFFYTDYRSRLPYAATLEQCYADCEADPVCAAVTYVFGPTNSCTPLSSTTGMGSFGSGQALNGMGQGEVKGMTCAEVKDYYTDAADWNCCDARRASVSTMVSDR